jgi:hypothetical protein
MNSPTAEACLFVLTVLALQVADADLSFDPHNFYSVFVALCIVSIVQFCKSNL